MFARTNLMHFRTAAGQRVDLWVEPAGLDRSEECGWTCHGCGAHDQDDNVVNRLALAARMREDAGRHAQNCRAYLPGQPTDGRQP